LTSFSNYLSKLNTLPLDLKAVARNVEDLQCVNCNTNSKRTFLSGTSILSNKWIPAWVPTPIQVDFISSTFEDARKTKHLEISVRVHFLLFGKSSGLNIDLILRPLHVLWTPLEFPRFTLRNEVSKDSELFVACKKGDSLRVWELLKTGRGSHRDIASDNSSPLRVSGICYRYV